MKAKVIEMLVSMMAVYSYDNTILDGLELPEGMNRTAFEKQLLLETAELNVIYSDPEFLKDMIEYWSLTRIEIWSRLWSMSQEEYDPLINYDRTETESLSHGKRTENRYTDRKWGNTQQENKTYGFDSTDPVGKDSSDVNHGSNGEGSNTEINSGTDTTWKTSKGNIGVTTYQQMMKEEMETRPKVNMYTYIIEDFKHQFCVLVY